MTTPIIILVLLTGPWLAGKLWARQNALLSPSPTTLGTVGVALVFAFTGIGHFIQTEPMIEMVPAWFPMARPIVYVTGVLEIVLSLAVLPMCGRRAAGSILIAMLLLFLPVNIYAAIHRVGPGGHEWGPVYLLIRVPLQAVLIGWIWWFVVRTAHAD